MLYKLTTPIYLGHCHSHGLRSVVKFGVRIEGHDEDQSG